MSRIPRARAALLPLLAILITLGALVLVAVPAAGSGPGVRSHSEVGEAGPAWGLPGWLRTAVAWLEARVGVDDAAISTASPIQADSEDTPPVQPSGPQPQAGETIDPDG